MKWQPIETAPKNGTMILGYDPSDSITPIYVLQWDIDDNLWREASGEIYAIWWEPTHWMPLPEPPKE